MAMKIEKMKKIEPGNPFLSDLYHMGHTVGTNCQSCLLTIQIRNAVTSL